jgi:hypothetical protein
VAGSCYHGNEPTFIKGRQFLHELNDSKLSRILFHGVCHIFSELLTRWREADPSPPSSAEVKECVELYLHSPSTPSWRGSQLKKQSANFTFTSPCVFMACCLVKYRDDFTFTSHINMLWFTCHSDSKQNKINIY